MGRSGRPIVCWQAIFVAMLMLAKAAPAWAAEFAPSSTLDAIKRHGEIVVGVKTDAPPFGMLDTAGHSVGFEVDLATRLAAELGVRVRFVGVSTENRFQRLEQGMVDVLIATATDTEERRRLATAIEPNYYGAGVGVLLRPEEAATDWPQLRGKTLCALQAAHFNRAMAERYLLKLQMYHNVRDALLALRDRRCAGYLYTDAVIWEYLRQPEWAGYRSPLPVALFVPWAINIARSERGTEFERLLGDVVAKFHREGVLVELERNWGLPPSRFLAEAQALWRSRDEQGAYRCRRDERGNWPVQCRNSAYVNSADAAGLPGFGLWLRESLGVDLSVLYDSYDGRRYLQGILFSLLLSATAIGGALALGFIGARLILSPLPALGGLAGLALNYARMTPPLLQMYIVFFGLGGYLSRDFGLAVSPFGVAALALSVYHAAIVAYALVEAALHLRETDPSYRLTWRTLPHLIDLSSVGIRSALTNLTKATTIASAIAVPELLYATVAIIGDRGNVAAMMNCLLIVFYLMTSFWIHLFARVERRLAQSAGQS
jgi:polar amino acid transport system substrate-binding protein